MKKYGLAVSCLICGLLLGLGVQTFAADSIRHVTASINETFRFVVDGEETELPEEYDVLVYNNRTYLPVRAVGDMLGAQIDWNGETEEILIQKPVYGNETDISEYKSLPQSYETTDYRLTLMSSSDNLGSDKLTRIFFRLTGFGQADYRIQPSGIALTADGKSYTNYSSDIDLSLQDRKLYTTYISEGEELDSYITLPEDIKNAKEIKVTIPVVTSSYKGMETETISFLVSLENKG